MKLKPFKGRSADPLSNTTGLTHKDAVMNREYKSTSSECWCWFFNQFVGGRDKRKRDLSEKTNRCDLFSLALSTPVNHYVDFIKVDRKWRRWRNRWWGLSTQWNNSLRLGWEKEPIGNSMRSTLGQRSSNYRSKLKIREKEFTIFLGARVKRDICYITGPLQNKRQFRRTFNLIKRWIFWVLTFQVIALDTSDKDTQDWVGRQAWWGRGKGR